MCTLGVRRCAPAFPFIRWCGDAQAATLATHQSEGMVRVRGRVCLRTPAPDPFG